MVVDEQRIAELERRTEALMARVERLEAGGLGVPRPGLAEPPSAVTAALRRPSGHTAGGQRHPTGVRPAPPPPRPAPTPARDARTVMPSLEDLLGGRVLAWVGGVAILVGLCFFFAYAISHGWIGESTRTLLAATGSLALLGAGVWLHERRGRTEAALTAVGTAVAALFLTIMVAARVYELIPVGLGLGLAFGVAALATALAVRWEARVVGALGIVGALLAPVMVGAPSDAYTMGFLFVAMLSAVGVLVWQRWDWLGLAVFAVGTPQWVAWLWQGPSLAAALIGLVLFGCAGAAAALGYELRAPAAKLRVSSSFLLALNAAVLAVAGHAALVHLGHSGLADAWLAALAAAHLAVGLAAFRVSRISADLRLLILGLGVVLADVAFGLIVEGPALAIGWASTSVAFAFIARHVARRREDVALAGMGLGGHIGLALLNAISQLDWQTAGAGDQAAVTIAFGAVAAGAFTSARLTAEGHAEWRKALDGLGLAVLLYLTAFNLDGLGLVVAWALEAAVLAQIARKTRDEVAGIGAVVFFLFALVHVLAVEAPPSALALGVGDMVAAACALAACAAASLALAHSDLRFGGEDVRPAFLATAALSLLYLASVAIVSWFQPGPGGLDGTVLDLGVRQQGQVLLSALWSTVGVGALIIGLRRNWRLLRLGALALLLVTVGKVFVYDLATLDSVYRVVSFIALGFLLLTGAYAYQRLRPRPLPDLRSVPRGVR